jgi:hypothetical protein
MNKPDHIVIDTVNDYFKYPIMPPTETEIKCWQNIKNYLDECSEEPKTTNG